MRVGSGIVGRPGLGAAGMNGLITEAAVDRVKGNGLAALASAAIRFPGGSVFPVSAGFVLLDHQILELPRHVAQFAVDQMHVAGEARRRRLVAEEFAHETVVLSHDVFQTPADVSKLPQLLRACEALTSVSRLL